MSYTRALALGIVGLLVACSSGPQVDSEPPYCLTDGRPSAQAIVLLDPSDTLSNVQRKSAPSMLLDILRDLPTTTEVHVYSVAHAGRGTAKPFKLCSPLHLHPDSIDSDFTQNADLIRRYFRERFLDPMRDTLTRRLESSGDTVSPILEALQLAVIDAFQPRNGTMPRHVLIVSDMVQNSRYLSFFRETPAFDRFRMSDVYPKTRIGLSGVSITVYQLARLGEAGKIQAGDLRTFWNSYFAERDATHFQWFDVEG